MNSFEKMKLCAGFASDMKAQNMVVLDVKEQSAFTSYFIICSGSLDTAGAGCGGKRGAHDERTGCPRPRQRRHEERTLGSA